MSPGLKVLGLLALSALLGVAGLIGLGAVMRYRTVTELELQLVNARATPIEALRVEFIEGSCGPHALAPIGEVVCRFHHRGATDDWNKSRVWIGPSEVQFENGMYRGHFEQQRLTFEADGGVSFVFKDPRIHSDWQEWTVSRPRDAGPQN